MVLTARCALLVACAAAAGACIPMDVRLRGADGAVSDAVSDSVSDSLASDAGADAPPTDAQDVPASEVAADAPIADASIDAPAVDVAVDAPSADVAPDVAPDVAMDAPVTDAPAGDGALADSMVPDALSSDGGLSARATLRALSPISGSIVVGSMLPVRWNNTGPAHRTRVELCADRACAVVTHQVVVDAGESEALVPVQAGVFWWRLRAAASDGTPSPDATDAFELVGRVVTRARTSVTCCTPDFNGDGRPDLAVGSPHVGSGIVQVFYGQGGGEYFRDSGMAVTLVDGGEDGERFGASVAAAGDVNGDGFVDLLVGAPGAGGGAGRAALYLGGARGVAASPAWSGAVAGDGRFGEMVSAAGDVNGDGYADWLVGSPDEASGGASFRGTARVYSGAASLAGDRRIALLRGKGMFDHFGLSGGPIGIGAPFNTVTTRPNDSRWEFALGGRNTSCSDCGRFVAFGGAADPSSYPEDTATLGTQGTRTGGFFGSVTRGAGDVNGDGVPDLLVAGSRVAGSVAAIYTDLVGTDYDSELHALTTTPPVTLNDSVAAAANGDLDGDGASDVVITGQAMSASGAGWVYLGVTGGPPGAVLPDATLPGSVVSGSSWEGAVSMIGDIDGAPGDEFAVGDGAYRLPSDDAGSHRGRVLVFRVSRSGATATVSMVQSLVGSDPTAHFGAAMSTR